MNDVFGIIAGNGELPVSVCDTIVSNYGTDKVFYVSLKNISEPYHNTKVISEQFFIGEIRKIVRFLKNNHVNKIIFLGGLKRPSTKDIKCDLLGLFWLYKLRKFFKKGDDALLSELIRLTSSYGFQVIGIHEIAPKLISSKNDCTTIKPSASNISDIELGSKILDELSKFDIGQSIVIQNGIVLGIEGVEGTDELIKRTGVLKKNSNVKPVLVKKSKVNQSIKADLPTIGLNTIENLYKYGFAGIAIEQNKTIILNKKTTLKTSEKSNLFITVI